MVQLIKVSNSQKTKAGAKPLDERQPYNETEQIIDYIRNKMGCNVDEVKYKGAR